MADSLRKRQGARESATAVDAVVQMRQKGCSDEVIQQTIYHSRQRISQGVKLCEIPMTVKVNTFNLPDETERTKEGHWRDLLIDRVFAPYGCSFDKLRDSEEGPRVIWPFVWWIDCKHKILGAGPSVPTITGPSSPDLNFIELL
jgi:hypothetical protein